MIKSIVSVSLALASLFASSNAFSACYIVGEASIRGRPDFRPVSSGAWDPNAATAEQTWNDTETLRYNGSELGSSLGVSEDTNKAYRGPAQAGFSIFGPYASTQGSQTSIKGHIRVSIAWNPDMAEVCTKHKTRIGQDRVCVEKGLVPLPTSFVVDISTNVGQAVPYSAQFTSVNSLGNTFIDMPELICDGGIDSYEVRIHSHNGGSGEFIVHELVVDKSWKY